MNVFMASLFNKLQHADRDSLHHPSEDCVVHSLSQLQGSIDLLQPNQLLLSKHILYFSTISATDYSIIDYIII